MDDIGDRTEYATDQLCQGVPRLTIESRLRRKFKCSYHASRTDVTRAFTQLSASQEGFNEVGSKLGMIEHRYYRMLAGLHTIKSTKERVRVEMSILRSLTELLGANLNIKDRVTINIQNNSGQAKMAIDNALHRLEDKPRDDNTVIEVTPEAAEQLVNEEKNNEVLES